MAKHEQEQEQKQEYNYPFFDKDNKVVCQHCGRGFLVISPMHLKMHGLTFSEYKLMYPDAPLSSEEFVKRGHFSKVKDMFIEEMMGEETPVEEDEFFSSEPIYEDEIKETKKFKDITQTNKEKVLEYLSYYFSNVQKDYLIRIQTIDGKVIFESISDFADPVLKLDFEFPRAFWHNQGMYDDPNRDQKLKEGGWEVIRFKTNAPTFDIIKKRVEKL